MRCGGGGAKRAPKVLTSATPRPVLEIKQKPPWGAVHISSGQAAPGMPMRQLSTRAGQAVERACLECTGKAWAADVNLVVVGNRERIREKRERTGSGTSTDLFLSFFLSF